MNYRLTEQDIRLMLGSTYECLECWPDDGLHGRRVVYTNTKQITADNVVEVVGKALTVHMQNAREIQYLSAGNSMAKYEHSNTSSDAIWSLRSPMKNYSQFFLAATNGTYQTLALANGSEGFSPCFCV